MTDPHLPAQHECPSCEDGLLFVILINRRSVPGKTVLTYRCEDCGAVYTKAFEPDDPEIAEQVTTSKYLDDILRED